MFQSLPSPQKGTHLFHSNNSDSDHVFQYNMTPLSAVTVIPHRCECKKIFSPKWSVAFRVKASKVTGDPWDVVSGTHSKTKGMEHTLEGKKRAEIYRELSAFFFNLVTTLRPREAWARAPDACQCIPSFRILGVSKSAHSQ